VLKSGAENTEGCGGEKYLI